MTNRNVTIDYDLLCQELTKQGKTKSGFSHDLGMGKTYINWLKTAKEIPESMEKLMSLLLGKEPGYFIKRQQVEKKPVGDAAILQNIFQKLCKIEEMIGALTEEQEAVFRKCNANTIQLERIREAVGKIGKTEYDRAVEFLKRVLADGRVNAFELLADADEQGIKRSEIMKAKKDLNVIVDSSGYGKNQKSWWYFGGKEQ